MEITWPQMIPTGLTIISFVYALIERSKRMPLWHIIKGLEQGTLSNMALYTELKTNYNEDIRDSIPTKEVIAHIENAIGHWRSKREIISGIRQSIGKEKGENR